MNILTSSHSRETFNIISSEICVKGEVNDMEDKNEMGKKKYTDVSWEYSRQLQACACQTKFLCLFFLLLREWIVKADVRLDI